MSASSWPTSLYLIFLLDSRSWTVTVDPNITFPSLSILVTSIYTIIINSSDGTNDFMNKLMDYIGYIVVAFFYVLLLNFLVRL